MLLKGVSTVRSLIAGASPCESGHSGCRIGRVSLRPLPAGARRTKPGPARVGEELVRGGGRADGRDGVSGSPLRDRGLRDSY